MRDTSLDTSSAAFLRSLKSQGYPVVSARIVETYFIDKEFSPQELKSIASGIFVDSIVHDVDISNSIFNTSHRIEISFLPGVTDNIGQTAKEAIYDFLGKSPDVYFVRTYVLDGSVSEQQLFDISKSLHNPVIERAHFFKPHQPSTCEVPRVEIKKQPTIEFVDIPDSDTRMALLAKERLLSLSVEELKVIRDHFLAPSTVASRKKKGLPATPTDVELECLAQTWSEHCKHKIFNATIDYDEDGERHIIHSLFKTFIRGSTESIKKPYIVSVFKDNGGIIKFNHAYDIAIKVETHNSPSALDPYGGALTGVLGVQRDIMGTGMGALPIANLDVLCFGPPHATDVPRGVIPPRKIMQGVVKGIEHGGNKMGIPTVNGSIVFDSSYTTRPLVYCGTVGLLPAVVNGNPSSEKSITKGMKAVMVGGRIGKDGIHGATFSSQVLDPHVPQSVVQIGDPFTQKKLFDFLVECRDLGLYSAVTDNGAGGISSSIGELAQLSGGCVIELDKAPLKYPGLEPWEILISESQERMTISVDEENLKKIQKIAKKHDVEATAVGTFTDSGFFECTYLGKTVAYLPMEFLHNGVPTFKLSATWKKKAFSDPVINETDLSTILHMLLASPTIASKESVVRLFDHEVKAMSVIKPFSKGPNDAAVIKPLPDSYEGIVVSHGINPFVVQDSYDMAALSFDEAVRNAICVGAKIGYLSCLDNFSWPDPVQSEKTPDGPYKLAQLVRACISLYDCTTHFGIPLISGKDSMKNDYYGADMKHSIKPTLLVTVLGKIDDVRKAVSMDFKAPGDNIYLLGETTGELGGSQYYHLFNGIGAKNPSLNMEKAFSLYRALSQAMEEGIVASCHDISDGGLAVALSESAFSSGFGCDADLSSAPRATEQEDALLFSESPSRFVVSVKPEHSARFEELLAGNPFGKVGRVRGDKRFVIRKGDRFLVNEELERLKHSWANGLAK